MFSLILALLVCGCADPIRDLVNKRFPPVSLAEQRQAAIATNATALSKMPLPNIGVGISLKDVQSVIQTDALIRLGVKKLNVDGDEQMLRVEVEFDKQFLEVDAASNVSIAGLIGKAKPRVSGVIVLQAGLASALVKADTTLPVVELRLLPALETIQIDKLVLADKVDVNVLADGLEWLLNRFKDNLSGELSRAPISRVTIPALAQMPIDVSQSFQLNQPGGNATIAVAAKPFVVPVALGGIAWLVSKQQLTALIQLNPIAQKDPATSVNIDATHRAIEDRFNGVLRDTLEVPDWNSTTWVAVRKDLVALVTNSLVTQADLCVSAAVSSPEQTASKKISLPNGLGISCHSERTCNSSRKCEFKASEDTRNCRTCLVPSPRICSWTPWGDKCIGGGGCVTEGNDPFCEVQKGTQNAIYLADANLRKADCDRLREMENATCEVEKAGEKLLCETKKEVLNRFAATGNFANLDTSARFGTDNLNVCMKDFQVTSSLERVQFALDVAGEAQAQVNVKFVPLDIVGHLTCQFPWTKEQQFTASLRESRVGIASNVRLTTDNGAVAAFDIDPIAVKAKLSPGPTEFLVKSPDLMLKCPVLAGIAPIALSLTPFIPELRGELNFTTAKQQASVPLRLPELLVGARKVNVKLTTTPLALVATGELANAGNVASKQ